MKGFALESVVKFIVFLGAASVLLSLVMFFSANIQNFLKGELGEEKEIKTESVNQHSWSSSQLAAYINSCWEKTKEYEKDVICYVLTGDMNSVNTEEVKNMVKGNVDFSEFDKTKGIAIIEFRGFENLIVVKSK